MIDLVPIPKDATAPWLHLSPLPQQAAFAGPAIDILADPRPATDFHGIRSEGTPVGVFKIDRDYEDGRHFAPPDAWGLRGFMVDAAAQGRGVASAVMTALPGYLSSTYPELSQLWLTVNCRNPAARAVYLKGGWVDTGQLHLGGSAGPQHILRLDL